MSEQRTEEQMVEPLSNGWDSIKWAPKDGEHILAVDMSNRAGFGAAPGKLWQPCATVVHWFQDGWYTSVNELEPERPFPATHFMKLPDPPVLRPCGCLPREHCKECY